MSGTEQYHLRLFVAGNNIESMDAINNLERVKALGYLQGAYIEVLDIKQHPELAVEHSVIVTPMLIMEAPKPKVTIVGGLTDTNKVIKALRLPVKKKVTFL